MLAVGLCGHPSTWAIQKCVLGAIAGYTLLNVVALKSTVSESNYLIQVPSIALLNILPIIPALASAFMVKEKHGKPWAIQL